MPVDLRPAAVKLVLDTAVLAVHPPFRVDIPLSGRKLCAEPGSRSPFATKTGGGDDAFGGGDASL
jgi:hypothetical protein